MTFGDIISVTCDRYLAYDERKRAVDKTITKTKLNTIEYCYFQYSVLNTNF